MPTNESSQKYAHFNEVTQTALESGDNNIIVNEQ